MLTWALARFRGKLQKKRIGNSSVSLANGPCSLAGGKSRRLHGLAILAALVVGSHRRFRLRRNDRVALLQRLNPSITSSQGIVITSMAMRILMVARSRSTRSNGGLDLDGRRVLADRFEFRGRMAKYFNGMTLPGRVLVMRQSNRTRRNELDIEKHQRRRATLEFGLLRRPESTAIAAGPLHYRFPTERRL